MTLCHCVDDIVSASATAEIPALFTRISSRPNSLHGAFHHGFGILDLCHISFEGNNLSAVLLEVRRDAL